MTFKKLFIYHYISGCVKTTDKEFVGRNESASAYATVCVKRSQSESQREPRRSKIFISDSFLLPEAKELECEDNANVLI